MLDCICQLQLTLKEHLLLNSKQAEYQMSQNGDLFSEMIKGQNRRDLDSCSDGYPNIYRRRTRKVPRLDQQNKKTSVAKQDSH